MPVTMNIRGLDELKKKFASLKEHTQGSIIKSAAISGAMVIQNAAVLKCPKDTGDLSRSIHTEVREQSSTHVLTEIGTDVDYAAPVEFGTKRMGAQPYMRPAFDNYKLVAIKEIRAALAEQINAV